MKTDLRAYDHARDLDAVRRIWFEVGWLESDDDAKYLADFLSVGETIVACIDGEPECAVHATPGALRHLETDVPMCAITAVTTSRIGRQLGLAGRLTAQSLADGAAAGACVAALGMFDQGFYDRVGFGSGAYDYRVAFDPATLSVAVPYRTPRRLTRDDWPAMQQAMVNRQRAHGGVVLTPPEIIKAELGWVDPFFGLGYFDDTSSRLTHFIAGEANGENGPYNITWTGYQNTDQLLELLALIRALGDQVSMVRMMEPPEIQLQDLLKTPFRQRRVTSGSKFENTHRAMAYWQARILDVPGCLAVTRLPWASCRFNLQLTDPVSDRDDVDWSGTAGSYVVNLAGQSSASPGEESGLPTLRASVGAFTRLWLGVRPATSLSVTDALAAPADLLTELDQALRLPRPVMGWDF